MSPTHPMTKRRPKEHTPDVALSTLCQNSAGAGSTEPRDRRQHPRPGEVRFQVRPLSVVAQYPPPAGSHAKLTVAHSRVAQPEIGVTPRPGQRPGRVC